MVGKIEAHLQVATGIKILSKDYKKPITTLQYAQLVFLPVISNC